ncbi:MAG: hypothetical protein AB1782_16850 [Cyanobacteriota bacterium]
MSVIDSRAIALIDCDSFYVSCEQLIDPHLRYKPVCVMSNNDGCIVARSKEAKKLGVKMGMPVFQAKKDFPQVIYISGRLDLYGEISNRVMNILKNYTPEVEIYSIDEAFVDLTGLRKLYKKSYLQIADSIRTEIKKSAGIPVSIGVSSSKVLAKLATNRAKNGDGFYRISFRGITEELKRTQLIEIWGFGNNTCALLNKFGIFSAYEYTLQNDSWIKKTLGKKGLEIKYELMGESIYPVTDKINLPKTIQKTSSFASFTSNKHYIRNALHYHAHRACKKLRKHKIKTNLVGIMLKTKNFKVYYGSKVLLYHTDWEFEIFNTVDKIFQEIFVADIIYRSSGITLGNFVEASNSQLSLFENNLKQEAHSKLGTIWDSLEEKYGRNILSAGAYIEKANLKYDNNSNIDSN